MSLLAVKGFSKSTLTILLLKFVLFKFSNKLKNFNPQSSTNRQNFVNLPCNFIYSCYRIKHVFVKLWGIEFQIIFNSLFQQNSSYMSPTKNLPQHHSMLVRKQIHKFNQKIWLNFHESTASKISLCLSDKTPKSFLATRRIILIFLQSRSHLVWK